MLQSLSLQPGTTSSGFGLPRLEVETEKYWRGLYEKIACCSRSIRILASLHGEPAFRRRVELCFSESRCRLQSTWVRQLPRALVNE
jgi:hypothetical protein